MTPPIERLRVWQAATRFSADLDRAIVRFPSRAKLVLEKQMMDAAESVTSNIAESTGRNGLRDQIRVLHIASGSAREVESQLVSARNRGALPEDEFRQLHRQIRGVQQLLEALIRYKWRRISEDES